MGGFTSPQLIGAQQAVKLQPIRALLHQRLSQRPDKSFLIEHNIYKSDTNDQLTAFPSNSSSAASSTSSSMILFTSSSSSSLLSINEEAPIETESFKERRNSLFQKLEHRATESAKSNSNPVALKEEEEEEETSSYLDTLLMQ
jgi:hypothetical protein